MEKNVSQDATTRIAGAVNRRIAALLYKVKEHQADFEPSSFIGYLLEHGGFTPKQLLLLDGKFEKFKIEYEPKDFKIILRKKEHKDQLSEMALPVVKKLAKYMSAEQKKNYNDFIGKYSL